MNCWLQWQDIDFSNKQTCDLVVRQNHGQRRALRGLPYVRDRVALGELPTTSMTEQRAQDVPDLRLRAILERPRHLRGL